MKKIRIGNDISIAWTLKSGEEAYNLAGRRFEIRMFVSGNMIAVASPSVSGNVISFIFRGKDQRLTGTYSLLYVENPGQNEMVAFDERAAFELVSHSWQTGGKNKEGIQAESVEITSSLSTNAPTYDEIIAALGYVPDANVIEVIKVNGTPQTPDSGKAVNIIIPDASGKADKVSGATAGHIATLDSSGNLVDSGKGISDINPLWGNIQGSIENQTDLMSALGDKYEKPSTGIPASDLASDVIPDVSNFITASVDNLVNYYLKAETYTKAEVLDLIRAIQLPHFETYASTSEVTNPQGNVLYLIGPTGSGEDKYEEYVYDATKQNPWVKIGDTSIDLSNYVTTSDLNTALSAYTTSAELETILEDYVTSDDLENLLEEKQSFGSGTSFPQNPKEGDVFVLTDSYIHDIEAVELINSSPWQGDPYIYYTPNVAGKLRVQVDEEVEDYPSDCWVLYGDIQYQFQDYDLHVFDIPATVRTVGFIENDPGGMIATSVLSFEYPAGVYEYDGIRWDRKISVEDKESWNNKYDKPVGGIPKTDLASAVQTSLGKADTAYQKPQNGIPASDLASGVLPKTIVLTFTPSRGLNPIGTKAQAATAFGITEAQVDDLVAGEYDIVTYSSGNSVGYKCAIHGDSLNGLAMAVYITASDENYNLTFLIQGDTYYYAYVPVALVRDVQVGGVSVLNEYGIANVPEIPYVDDFITKDVDDLTYYYTKTEIDSKVSSAYKAAGTVASVASLGTLDAAHEGFVYNMSASFTTTSDFVEGTGITHPAGTNVAIVNTGTVANPVYKYDVLAGFVDISGKADKSEMSVVDGTDANADKTTITLKSGTSATVLKSHQNISGKADKVSNATNGHLAGLDSNGNLTDSGKSASDFQPTIDSSNKLPYSLISGTPTIPDAVEANPTVPSGTTPTALTGLKIGNGYYGIEGAVSDVTVGGTSVVNNGVAVIPQIPTVASMAAADIATAVDTAWNAVMS